MSKSPFYDVLHQELFPGAIVIFPSAITRNYYDYGVVESVHQFSFNVSVISAEQTILPDRMPPVEFSLESFTSALDRGILVIHPDILRHSNHINPRYWKKLILNHSLGKIHPKA